MRWLNRPTRIFEVGPADMDDAAGRGDSREVDLLRAQVAELTAERDRLAGEVAELQARYLKAYGGAGSAGTSVIVLDERFSHPAFYFAERIAPGREFRWMGREAEAILPTTIPRTRAVRVDVHIEVYVNEETLEGLQLHIDGEPAITSECEHLDDGRVCKRFIVPAPREPDPFARMNVGLVLDTRVDMTPHGDPRRLAVAISRIEVVQLTEDDTRSVTGWRRTVPADSFRHAVFHQAERDEDGQRFAWAGADDHGHITVNLPPGEAMRIDAYIVVQASEEALNTFRFGIGERLATTYSLEPRGQGQIVKRAEMRVPGTRGEPLREFRVPLVFGSRKLVPDPDGGNRLVAVGLRKFVFRAIDEAEFTGPGRFRTDLWFDEAFEHPAFYYPERHKRGPMFRWMGLREEAAVRLRVMRGRPLRVCAHIEVSVSDATLEGLRIGLDGTYADDYEISRLPGGRILKTARFDPLEGSGEGEAELGLRLLERVDMKPHGDPRTLGVALSKIVVAEV